MIGNLVQLQTCKQTLMCKIITQLLIRTKETRKQVILTPYLLMHIINGQIITKNTDIKPVENLMLLLCTSLHISI